LFFFSRSRGIFGKMNSMKTLETWLSEYGESHQNPLNKAIHWVCIPLIFFSVVGFLYLIELPFEVTSGLKLNMAMVAVLLVTLYYMVLSKTLWIGMMLFAAACIAVCYQITISALPLGWISLVVFVLAWIVQFYGHNVEGKKPSFIKDLQFLMIGPAWLMSFLYKKAGLSY